MNTLVQMKGWKALLVLVLAAGLWGFSQLKAARTLDTEAVAAVRPWLTAALAREALGNTSPADVRALSEDELRRLSEAFLETQRLQIVSIQAHGSGEDIVCRVEFLVDGHPPRTGKTPRYFDMNYSLATGWICRGETTAFAYYLAGFRRR